MPWWLTFLFAFAVAAVAIGALCWQLWRHRDYETERRQYWNAKMKAEMNYPDEPMNVADLIAALQQHDPRATVVVWDHTASDQPAVAKLGYGEVQTMQLGAWESNGLRVLEVWAPNMGLDGPFAGVVLGDGLAPITAEQHKAIDASEASEPIGAPPDTALHPDIMTMMNNGTVAAPGPSSFRVEPDSQNRWSSSSPVGMWAGCL